MTQLCVYADCLMPGHHADECDDGECRSCWPAPARDGLYLCSLHTDGLGRDAFTAAARYRALSLQLQPSGQSGEYTSGSGKDPGVDLNPAAVEARDAIRAILVGLVRMVSEERGVSLPWRWKHSVEQLPEGFIGPPRLLSARVADNTAPGLAGFIHRHREWLAAHHAAAEHCQDLRDLVTDPRSMRIAYPASTDRMYLGDCPLLLPTEDGARRACGTRLYQRAQETLVTCTGCEVSAPAEWWHSKVTSEPGAVVDAYAAAAHLAKLHGRPVDAGLVRKWGQRYASCKPLMMPDPTNRTPEPGEKDERRWIPVRDERSRVLFRLDDVVATARKLWGEPEVVPDTVERKRASA